MTTTTKKKKTRKAPGGINPAVILSALGVQNILRPGDGGLSYLLRAYDDNIIQDMTCLITLF